MDYRAYSVPSIDSSRLIICIIEKIFELVSSNVALRTHLQAHRHFLYIEVVEVVQKSRDTRKWLAMAFQAMTIKECQK